MRKLRRRLEPFLSLNSSCDNSYSIPYVGSGHQYEAEEVVRCLKMGKLESDLMPLDDTIEIIRIMDQIRAQLDIRYPHENNYDQVGGRD